MEYHQGHQGHKGHEVRQAHPQGPQGARRARLLKARDEMMKLARKEQAALAKDPYAPLSAKKGFAPPTERMTAQQRADKAGFGQLRKALLRAARQGQRKGR